MSRFDTTFNELNSNIATSYGSVTVVPGAVTSVNGYTGDVVLNYEDVGASPATHTHDDRYYTESESDALLLTKAASVHTHAQTDITGLETAMSGKAAAVHTHSESDITNLSTDLAGKANAVHTHDDRYFTETEVNTALASKANVSHTHTQADVTGLTAALGNKADAAHTHDDRYYTETEVNTALAGKSAVGHTHNMNDVSGLNSAMAGKAAIVHSHAQADVTGLASSLNSKITEPNSDGINGQVLMTDGNGGRSWGNVVGGVSSVNNKTGAVSLNYSDVGAAPSVHTHDDRYYTESDVNALLAGKASATHSHTQSDVTGLSDALTGKASVVHTHTESDITGLATDLAGKAPSVHTHDDRYYTETETDTLLTGKAASVHTHAESDITNLVTDLAGKASVSHSHDDRYYTETETDTLLSGKAAASHTHDDRYYTETEADTLLAGKAASSHSHAQSDITGLTSALSSKINEPASEGANGQVLTTDGNGIRSWQTVQGGVTSVNGETGAVVLDADDVGALKSSNTTAGSAEIINADQLGGHNASYFQQALGGSIETWTFTLTDGTVVTKKVLILP